DAPGARVRETLTPADHVPETGLVGVAAAVQLAADATDHTVGVVAAASVASPEAREKVTPRVCVCVLVVDGVLVKVMLPVLASETARAAVTLSLQRVVAVKPVLVIHRGAACTELVEVAWPVEYAQPAPAPASTEKVTMPATSASFVERPKRRMLMRAP